jgi:hypothetical protein
MGHVKKMKIAPTTSSQLPAASASNHQTTGHQLPAARLLVLVLVLALALPAGISWQSCCCWLLAAGSW